LKNRCGNSKGCAFFPSGACCTLKAYQQLYLQLLPGAPGGALSWPAETVNSR